MKSSNQTPEIIQESLSASIANLGQRAADFEIFQQIVTLLQPFDHHDRARILKTAMVFFNIKNPE